MGFGKFVQSFRSTIDNTTATLRGIFWIGAIMVAIGILITEWLSTLTLGQWILLGIGLLFLFLVGITYFIDWRRKKDIENIPQLLTKLDYLTLEYVDNAKVESDKPEMLLDDLSKLWNMDIMQLKSAVRDKNRRRIGDELERISNKYADYANRKDRMRNTISELLLVSGILDDHQVGLANITNTFKYQNLYHRIRNLQKQVHVVEINSKINDYFYVSKGLYSVLLSTKPIMNIVDNKELIPVKVRANNNIMRMAIESQMATLISSVRESILNAKRDE